MVEQKKVAKKEEVVCKDRLCPAHGDRKLKMRGRTFEGVVGEPDRFTSRPALPARPLRSQKGLRPTWQSEGGFNQNGRK